MMDFINDPTDLYCAETMFAANRNGDSMNIETIAPIEFDMTPDYFDTSDVEPGDVLPDGTVL